MLREAIANEPAAFKSKVEPLISQTLKTSSAMGEAAKAHDDGKLTAAHDQFAAAVKSVLDQFPQELRPKAGGRGGPGGPPPSGSAPPHS
jgi:hypothetical protein